MPRPKTKDQLLELASTNYDKLQAEITHLTPEEMTESGVVEIWSVKDVLAHLTAWQQMTLSWYRIGKTGETPITPSEKYTWREIPALNQEIYETYRDAHLDDIQRDFTTSHEETMALIESIDDEELFTPKVYQWTKTTTVGAYFISATSSHYDWARKEIRRWVKRKSKQTA